MRLSVTTLSIPLACLGAVGTAHAAEPRPNFDVLPAEPSHANVPEDVAVTTTPSASDRGDGSSSTPWIRRWAPTRNSAELGAYAGALFPSASHELYRENDAAPNSGYQDLAGAAGTFGARVGYLPIRFLGLELEGGAAPTRTERDDRATLWTVRGSVVGQLGLWSVVPFVLAGPGVLGVASSSDALGRDADASFHFGGGVKVNLNRRVQVRLDVRDTLAARRGVADGVGHNAEVLLGAAVVLGKRPTQEPAASAPGDRDRDGFADPRDACPDRPGVAPEGCPIADSDADGFLDPDDRCPDVAGIAPDGCPALDRDRDGFLDAADACPEEPGVEPDGCPLRDRDGDKVLDVDDRCPDEPETRNGFEDIDGCPDELPDEVKAFSGVIEGIYFDVDKATIRSASRPVLERAVSVLSKHPTVRIEISGHTDSTGRYDHNLDLSARRAAAVKHYLVDHGVAEDRILTRGAGPDEPVADNTVSDGRQKNRRIEFRILEQ